MCLFLFKSFLIGLFICLLGIGRQAFPIDRMSIVWNVSFKLIFFIKQIIDILFRLKRIIRNQSNQQNLLFQNIEQSTLKKLEEISSPQMSFDTKKKM